MITFLTRLLIKNSQDTKNPAVRQAYGTLCGAAGIGFNLLLFAGKAIAGLLSNSISIMADAFNNLSDAGSSIITLVGFRMSGQEPDPDHPFGHGRIEYLAGLIVSGIILLMAAELIKSSVSKILHPEELTFSPVIVAILAASILGKALYVFVQPQNSRGHRQRRNEGYSHRFPEATPWPPLRYSWPLWRIISPGFTSDGWCGLLVGLFICRAGISAARDTINPLLGQPPEKEFVEQIRRIVLSHPDVLGMHDLIVHNYAPGE